MGGFTKVLKKVFKTKKQESIKNVSAKPAKIKNFQHEIDQEFISFYQNAIQVTGSPHCPDIFPERLYNTIQFFRASQDLDGAVAECGCFMGLSSYVICSYLRAQNAEFRGQGYHIFDSFEGLSVPTNEDKIKEADFGKTGSAYMPAGWYKGDLEGIQKAFSLFPEITYHQGWIPESLQGIEERQYKFVHIDLDLYEPIKGALEYFHPRMVPNGMIVIDEYGFPRWPGAKKAVDEYCNPRGIQIISLTTGNGAIIKRS